MDLKVIHKKRVRPDRHSSRAVKDMDVSSLARMLADKFLVKGRYATVKLCIEDGVLTQIYLNPVIKTVEDLDDVYPG